MMLTSGKRKEKRWLYKPLGKIKRTKKKILWENTITVHLIFQMFQVYHGLRECACFLCFI